MWCNSPGRLIQFINLYCTDMMETMMCLTLLLMGVSWAAFIIPWIRRFFVFHCVQVYFSIMVFALVASLLQSWGVQGLTGMSLETSATNLLETKRHGALPRKPAGVWGPNSYPSSRWQSRAGWKATCTWVWYLEKQEVEGGLMMEKVRK